MLKPETYNDGLYFVPLGGSEQFGVNLNVYMAGGKMLAIDCGIGFADERFPGIDLLLPDPELLEEARDDLEGLVITHAHEDHIGAVAYLWDRLKCPIYTTPFTACVLADKLKEAGLRHVPVHVIEPEGSVKLGPFHLTFCPVAHSVPDACAVLIETREGRVLHSGDWNLDPNPVVGYKTEGALFKKIARKGITAYVGDSTNAEVSGRAGSESEVEAGLYEEFIKCEGRIAVTTFSSNIGRIISIARAAQKAGRNVAVIGRSLHRMIAAAVKCGYMDDVPDFVDESDLNLIPDPQLVVICTGSQGESRAALARMARGEHRSIGFKKSDTVIFSARAIPGNEKHINAVKNNLSHAGVRIVTPSDSKHIIHVSGHPCRDEIAEMFQWLKPDLVVPVHGERTQLEAHANFARKCQIKDVIVPSNGSVIRLAPNAGVIDHVPTDILAVDMKRIIKATHKSIVARRKLQYTGTAHISLALDKHGNLVGEPHIHTSGLFGEGDQPIEDSLREEILDILDDMDDQSIKDDHAVSEELRIGVRRFCDHLLKIKPLTSVHVIRV